MSLPDEKSFRDLTSNTALPQVAESGVDIYLSSLDGNLDAGRPLYDAT